MSEEQLERGVRNPKVIDLIAKENDGVTLVMLEDRPWSGTKEHIEQLEEKVNNYLDYVLDGWFVKQYPQYENTPVSFRLECVEAPKDLFRQMLDAAETYCATKGITFAVRVAALNGHA